MKNTHLIVLVLLFSILMHEAAEASEFPLHQGDSACVVNFLNLLSTNPNLSNGLQLNPLYSKELPETWAGFIWIDDEELEVQRLSEITISNKNLKGNLDFTGCTHIRHIYCDGNALDSIKIQDSRDMLELSCRDNKLHSLDLSGFTKLQTLHCDNNNISLLDVRDCGELVYLTTLHNNLTFMGLYMPLGVSPRPFWNLGKQKPYLPKEVKIFGLGDHVSEGVNIDLSVLGGKQGTTFTWKYEDDFTTVASPDVESTGDFADIFTFSNQVAFNKIYCTITNTLTHHNLEIITETFELSYKYNENDVLRLRAFLDKTSNIPNITNGLAVNSEYLPNDPRSFYVEWSNVEYSDGTHEMRVTDINSWDNKDLAGTLDLTGTDYLDRIIVKNNYITEIIFNNPTNIKLIDCSNNYLEQFDASKHPQLIQLMIAENNLKTLDVSENTKLSYLNCDYNSLNNIELSALPNLKEIYCSNNELTALNVELLENIERVFCDNNLLTELKTEGLTKLKLLVADNNKISGINLLTSKELVSVSLNDNNLNSLNLEALSKLKYLECSNNKLNFNTLILPQGLTLDPNNILLHPQDTIARNKFTLINDDYVSNGIEIDLSEYIYSNTDYATTFIWKLCDNNGGSSVIGEPIMDNGKFVIPSELEGKTIFCELACPLFNGLTLVTPRVRVEYAYSENDVSRLRVFLDTYSKFGNEANGKTNGIILSENYRSSDPTTFPVEWEVYDNVKRLKAINWGEQTELKGELNLIGCNKLINIDLSCVSNLNRNDISALLLDNCTELLTIKVDYNQIQTFSVENCPNIVSLSASNNKISSDLLIVANNIDNINLSNNKISNIEVNNLPLLKNLDLSNNLIESLSINANIALVNLYCNNNALTQLNISNLTKLKQLDFSNNKIVHIDLTKQSNLSMLYCSFNMLEELKINNCIELIALRCSNNLLTKLDLTGINYITHLQADGNKLVFTSIEYGAIPNELTLYPQALIYPSNIDEKHILLDDSLILTEQAERLDSDTRYTLKYLNGEAVDYSLYETKDGVLYNFSPELSDKTMYCEMQNNRYPGLVLKTISFNSVSPMVYNSQDVLRLKTFLEQNSKVANLTNGKYLSDSYNADDPATYGVKWVAIDSEFHLSSINWAEKSGLQGEINLSGCNMLDSVVISGTYSDRAAIKTVNLKQCTALKVLDLSHNQLSGLDLASMDNLEVIIVPYNDISFIDVSHLNKLAILDVTGNSLTFSNIQLSVVPSNTMAWEPQKPIIPTDLVYENNVYKLKQNTISFKYLGNNLSYIWRNSQGNELILENTDGVFNIPEEWNNEVLNCTIISHNSLTNGLQLTTIDFLVDNGLGIDDIIKNNLSLYPNPAKHTIYVNLSTVREYISDLNQKISVNIYDIAGRFMGTCYNGDIVDNIEISLNQFSLSTGMYYLQCATADKQFILNLNIE